MPIPEEEELSNESQTDETKAEQLNIEGHRPKTPCIADTGASQYLNLYYLFYSYKILCTLNSTASLSHNETFIGFTVTLLQLFVHHNGFVL